MSWTLLHEMDYQKYMAVRYDYILLPEDAQTNTTRLRWWQPFTISNGYVVPGPDRSQWALDNILIGGAEINPSQLVDTFDDGMFITVLSINVNRKVHCVFFSYQPPPFFTFFSALLI